MDATQMISDSTLESDEEENEESSDNTRGRPVAKLCVLKNQHIPETELPLFLGNNVLGRDPNTCTLPLSAASVSKQHATICISVYRGRGSHDQDEMEALLWDLGSSNGTRKGRLKLTPNVRYALREGDSVVVADIPCQYVLCGVDSVVSSEGDTRTPVTRNPSVKARLSDDSRVGEGDACTGSKACVNGDAKPKVASCLSFEQTPTQPQKTLVPESDSDDETVESRERRCVTVVSDSDSHKSSPICSTFLSPTNKIVPESEDESPITPSSSTKNRPYKHVSFCTEETDVDVGRQQLKKTKTLEIVDDSEAEEERAAQGATNSKESGQNVGMKQESNGCKGGDESPVSIPAVLTHAIPAFTMDSDTDMEEEEEGVVSAAPLTLNTNQKVDQPPNTVQFHLDSDTDVEEDDDVPHKAPNNSSNETTKPPHSGFVIQPEDIGIDSDTDVEEDAAVSAKPASCPAASSMQLQEFHLDSDTDVDEEEDEGEQGHKNSKTGETLNKLDVKVIRPESAPAAPHSLHLDKDDETIPASTITEPTVAVRESCNITIIALSDSDTDMEDDSPVGLPAAVTTRSVSPCKTSEALRSDSDADTDVDESSLPPAGDGAGLADLRVDGDKDVEDKEAGVEEAGKDQIPSLLRENTPGFLVPNLQNCSTPVHLSASVAPAASPVGLSSCSDTQEDMDLAVAETQSFVLQSRDCHSRMDPTTAFVLEASDDKEEDQSDGRRESLQSDSSHLQRQNQALATECTQPFVSVGGDVISEDTQTCEATSAAEEDSSLEGTQAYAENEDSAGCSVASKKEENQVDLAFEATQAYTVPDIDSDDDSNQDEGQNTAAAETPPISSTLAFAETQPMSFFVEEENLPTGSTVCSVQQVNPGTQIETEEREEYGKDAQPQERPVSEAQYTTATQPINTSGDEEIDEDSFPGLRKRKAKPLQLEEEETQSRIQSVPEENQAVVMSEDDESDDMDFMPRPRKRKAKQLEEESQPLTNSEASAVESQSLRTCIQEQSGEKDEVPCRRKRKADSLQLEDGQTQPLTSSDVETQPIETSKEQGSDDDDDDDDSIPGPQRRKVKQLHLNSELSAAETQPIATTCEDDGADSMSGPRKRNAKHLEDKTQLLASSEVSANDDSVPVLPKRKAKLLLEEEQTQPLTESEISTVETQTKTDLKSQTEKGIESKAETSRVSVRNSRKPLARSREEEEQGECSVPPKRQARGENKTSQSTKEFRGKADDENSGEGVKQAKQGRGKRNTRQQKDDDEEKEMLEMEKSKHTVNESPTNEQEEGKQESEKVEETDERKEEQEEVERKDRREEKEKSECEGKVNKEQEKSKEEENKEEADKPKVSARGRRATRASQDTTSTNEDFLSRRTRSRSNSSNSVSSERSVSTLNAQEGKGSSRGRGARLAGKSPQAAVVRTYNRRATVAAGLTGQGGSDEVFNSSVTSPNRGRRQQGRGRKTEPGPDFTPAQSNAKPTARGRKSRRLEGSSGEVLHENDQEKADSQPTRTTRGRRRASADGSECAATGETDQSIQEEGCNSEETDLPKRNVRGRSQKAVRSTAVEESVSNENEAKDKRKGRKTEVKANIKGNDKSQPTEAAKEDKDTTKNENSATIQANRSGGGPAKKNAKDVEERESEKIMLKTVEKTPRGRRSTSQKAREKNEGLEESETSVTSVSQNSNEETTEPQTPTSSRSRRRQTSAGSCLVAKSPRYSSASPAASGRLRAAGLAYKVLFTGVVDEAGERVLARLGGSMAKDVADMNCLVTDKVRRTVKFLCAVAKGVPIVTTDWLEKSGEAGSFLPPNDFVVKDPEQEKKFNFCLQESLKVASSQPLLQGYDIHVTKSVKPEPGQMKDIISSSGANFLPKMPTTNKPHTVVISCEEDGSLCGPAVSASIPVVSAEFILTGILQQKLDFQGYTLSLPAANPKPSAGAKGKGKRKT